MTQALTYTVTMDANLARCVGVAAAMLYNLLVWQSQSAMVKDYDKDGWFYCTAEFFEEKTTYTVNTFTKAANALVEAGLVERQRKYVKYGYKNSNKSVMHFRIKKTLDDFLPTKNVSATHNECELNIKEENNKEEQQITANAGDLVPPTQFPLGAERSEKVSVRPNKKETDPARRPYAVGQAVLKAWGFKTAKIGVPMANLIKAWLDAGFTDKDIIEAGQMMKQSGDSYWAGATPIQMLTQNAMLWYQQHKQKQNLDDIPHIKIGDRYYEIEPQTGKPIREIKL